MRSRNLVHKGMACSSHQAVPPGDYLALDGAARQRLEDWFSGRVALTRQEAHALMDRALAAGYLLGRKAEHVAGIKALAAGAGQWTGPGFRILPDA